MLIYMQKVKESVVLIIGVAIHVGEPPASPVLRMASRAGLPGDPAVTTEALEEVEQKRNPWRKHPHGLRPPTTSAEWMYHVAASTM
jgi:hypothetical protein